MIRGWSWVGGKKHHYWIDAKADPKPLCRRWLVVGPNKYLFYDDKHDSPDNCAACRKLRTKLVEKGEIK